MRVLVTDAEARAVLAACRGLGTAGYDVTAIGSRRLAPALWSRATRARAVLPSPLEHADAFVDALAELVGGGDFDVLLAGSEPALLALSAARARLEPHVRLGLPPAEDVLRSLDKTVLQDEAAAVGLAPPASVVCATADAAQAAAADLGLPVLAKPLRSFSPQGAGWRYGGARLIAERSDIDAACAALGLPLTIQAFARDATVVSCAGVRIDGRWLGRVAARYLRTWPPDVGDTAAAVTSALPDGLAERVDELLGRLGWTGIFQLELLDLGGGRYGAIDFNPRPFGWLGLAVAAGANLPALWCDFLLGRPLDASAPAEPGLHYRWERAELGVLAQSMRTRQLRSVAALLVPHRHTVHALFQLRDPLPFVADALGSMRR